MKELPFAVLPSKTWRQLWNWILICGTLLTFAPIALADEALFFDTFVNDQRFADFTNTSAANIQFVGLEANTGSSTFFAHANYFRVTRLAEREPRLAIQCAGTNLVITWPASANFFFLQQSPSLNPFAPWANVWTTNAINGIIAVTNQIGGSSGFFRLREL